jgi:Ran GTPase-activating protein (RanGAP) involved in mRNA processing and transport
MSASEQISTFDSMFDDARFSAVLQFYAAITKLRTSRRFLSLVPHFLRSVPASIYDLVRKIIQKDSQALLVSLLNCLYEAQDTALCKYVGERLKNHVSLKLNKAMLYLSNMSLLPQDFLSIGYFLGSIAICCKGKFSVNLGSCSLSDTGIKILMQSLHRSLDSHSDISGHIDMDISNNGITGVGASYIAEALRTTRALRKLDLKCNRIGDQGLQYIAEALTTNTSLIELSLRDCRVRITEENGPALTKMLQRNKTLKELNLSYNEALSDNAASFIIEGLKNNTTLKILYLMECGFTNRDRRLIRSSTSTCKIVINLFERLSNYFSIDRLEISHTVPQKHRKS